ncbi:MAG: acetyl-CoA C-acetyltransferase [Acidobacteria bacterium]|nr:acetyl-CoA C-acetyltransferase [Acidobacteriota bacterium]
MNEAVIISAVRTAVGKFQGSLKSFRAPELGAQVVRAAIERAGIDVAEVDEVIMGNVIQAGLGQNPARQAALGAGLPASVAALTVNKVCGSGLKAVMLASQGIRTGDTITVVAGGMESMTNAPYLLPKARDGYRLGHGQVLDAVIQDGLWCAFDDCHMGMTGETVADKYGVSRRDQDEFAVQSHRRALAAAAEGRFSEEILPLTIKDKSGSRLFASDEGPRPDTSRESLAKLKPAFKPGGSVTAGNSSALNDGAAAVVVTSREQARRQGKEPLGRIVAQAVSGIEPGLVMMAPVEAIRKVLQKSGWDKAEVDLFEVNEAFAAQIVAIMRVLDLDPDRLNVSGGAIALGHPIGASGARVLVTMLYEMRRRGARRGVVSLCLGGGNAVAMAVER